MQSAKDIFYITLRDRLAAINAERTVVVRGESRPAILALENEAEVASNPLETFVLTWIDLAIDTSEPMPLHAMVCWVTYATCGSDGTLGTDRGRVLGAMDRELRTMLQPSTAAKRSFDVSAAVSPETNIFWSEPRFEAAAMKDGQITRTVAVDVFALQEEGD